MAPEVIYNILSFLTFPEVYQLRSICKKFQAMAEYHIYQQTKIQGETIIVGLDGGSKTIELVASYYDARNRVIEFIPKQENTCLSLANTSRQQWSAYHRLLKIHYSGWFTQQTQENYHNLTPQDQAMLMYHYQYNSAIEKTYELPSWNESSEIKNNDQYRYLGDKGLILSMSYEQKSNYKPLENQVQLQTSSFTSLPLSYYSYHSVASSTPMPSAPRMDIRWIRVTLDWVLSGMIKSTRKQTHIYEASFNKLNDMLRKEGCYKYDPLSEPILDFIIQDQESESAELPADLVNYVHSHTHECHTRLSRLQHMLEGAGVDSQVVWKYTFAKAFVVGNGLLCEEDIVRRIQDSEEEWRKKKKTILRKLNNNQSSRNLQYSYHTTSILI